jgi:hypothetical protein
MLHSNFFLQFIAIDQSTQALVSINGSEWLSDSAIFQPYHAENKLIFNEMMMKSALF